jgi:glycosyltransferase involved in cell wall biosynthesis
MRVAMDATPLALTSGGLARYTSELVLALATQFPEDEYCLVSDQNFAPGFNHLKRGSGPLNGLERRWWLWGLRREMERLGTDLFHGTNFAVPYLPGRPSVMSLHDLSPWMDRAWHHAAGRVRRRAPLLIKLGIATMIVTDSEAVRKQAIEYFRIHPGRIVAVPLAAAARFRPTPRRDSVYPYFLYVGALEPRKNIPLLLEAWRPVRDRHGIHLVLAGPRREDFAELPAEPGLRILGETAEEDLPALYSQALAFVYPSLYEGFGLPVLEAMQCGACVITSTDPAIGEVIGEAGPRLDPRDVRGWTAAMLACAAGGDWLECRRESSLARAAQFSWERTARATREIYIEALRRFHA